MGQSSGLGAGFSLAATGFKMAGDYLSSRGTAAGDVFKAQELEQQAQYGELKANQTNAQMTRNLAITLGHVDAVRAASHTDPSSPTGAAVRGTMEQIGTERKDITVENILQQTRQQEADAAYLRSAASNALLSGDIAMAGDLFSGLAGAVPQGSPQAPVDVTQPLPGTAPIGGPGGGIGMA